MADANGAPRRVSMPYILGFSDKPYKVVKLPAPPPLSQPRKPNQLTDIITTPGRIMEWTASDGRKGRLTGTGKPRLTAASLAKVPSEQPSTKELVGAKSTSNKAATNKPAADVDNPWVGKDWGETKSESKKPGSNKGDAWVMDSSGAVNNDPWSSAWATTADASGDNDKKDKKKDDAKQAWDMLPSAPDAPVACDNSVPSGEVEKTDEDPNAWTKEQDEKLMQMKAENVMTWAEIGKEISKDKDKCSSRFREIKPKDWKPNAQDLGEGCKGGEGKKRKNKDKNTNHPQDQNNGGKKKDDLKSAKEEEKKQQSDADNPWGALGGGFAFDTDDGKKDDADKANDTNNSGLNDATDLWGNKVGDGGTIGGGENDWDKDAGAGFDAGDSWGPKAGVGATTTNGVTINNQSNNNGGGISQGFDNQAWPTATKPASRPCSNKAPSRAHSQHDTSNKNNTQPIINRPLELEVKPDETFSADDLRLVARILQQDCSMVWNRVSWRFRDKTGRTLHPDEFEKKITGRLEGKGSEKGERRR